MKPNTILSLLATAVVLAACGQEAQTPEPSAGAPQEAAPQSPVDKLLNALGGADALRGLTSVALEASGSRSALDEHFMPGDEDHGQLNFTNSAYYDAVGDKLRIDVTRMRAVGAHESSLIIDGQLGVITGQDSQFGPGAPMPMTSDRWASVRKEAGLLNPHIAFRDQLLDGSVTVAADESLMGANHHVLVVDYPIAPIRLYVDADTGHITKLSTMETEHLRRDVAIEVMYQGWAPTEGGLAFPDSVTMTLDGETVHRETRSSVTVNAPLQAGLFEFPPGVSPTYDETLANWGRSAHQIQQIMANMGFPRAGQQTEVEVEEIGPGVHHVRGGTHHTMVVEQANGLVVVEAPLHEVRSEVVIDWIERTFPGVPITHVIATHHHTDHTAGLRAYVARGVTPVVHEAAEEFLADMFSRPSTLRPDALAENPRTVNIETMPADGSYTIPDDERAVEVYPLANEHAGDMVLVYVAGPEIVFVSDVYNPNPNAPPGPGGQAVQAAIEAAGIGVSVIAGGHGVTIDYETFQAAL